MNRMLDLMHLITATANFIDTSLLGLKVNAEGMNNFGGMGNERREGRFFFLGIYVRDFELFHISQHESLYRVLYCIAPGSGRISFLFPVSSGCLWLVDPKNPAIRL